LEGREDDGCIEFMASQTIRDLKDDLAIVAIDLIILTNARIEAKMGMKPVMEIMEARKTLKGVKPLAGY
jgi:hypothetical protein